MATRTYPSFLIYLDDAEEYRWHYQHSLNHKIEADSGEGYKTYKACEAGIEMMREGVRKAETWITEEVEKKLG